MIDRVLHRPFELTVSSLPQWKQRPLVYHFFEIVQIIEGEGVRIVNENEYRYRPGMVFLFTPMDCRGFESSTATRFCSIRFSEVFLGEFRSAEERERLVSWLRRLESIFYHHNRFQALALAQPEDEKLVATLIASLVSEYRRRAPSYEENLQHLVTLVLNVIARSLPVAPAAGNPDESAEPLINRVLRHVRQNLDSPEKLRVSHLAARFHISAAYLGEYFRKLTGESLSRYITQNRINLAQQRLAHSQLTLKQIAAELGFSDESHFTRQFRKAVGVSPGAYRKNPELAADASHHPIRAARSQPPQQLQGA